MAAAEGIDADIALGGTVVLARTRAATARAPAPRRPRRDGFGLDARAARRRGGPRPARRDRRCSARPTPRTARRSTRPSWSAAWPRSSKPAGRAIYEQTPVTAIEPGAVHTERGTVRADRRPRHRGLHPAAARAAPRAGARLLADHRHRAAARRVWDEIGLRERETFSDHRHLIIYGQRTRRRPAGVRRPRRAVPLRLADPTRLRPGAAVFDALRADAARAVPGAAPTPRSPTAGAARWASPGTGTPRSAWTARPGWPGPAATSATGCRPRTWPAARWPT